MNKRLQACLKYVLGANKLADIGTDHAYLPIEAVKYGYAKEAIASDINQGPLNQALENIKNANLENKIGVMLANGIRNLDDNVDYISICGMGGYLIVDILNDGIKRLDNIKRLILEPNTDASIVRGFLQANGFRIIDEEIVFDRKHYYEIIVAERGFEELSAKELFLGPCLLRKGGETFKASIKSKISALEKIDLDNMNDYSKKAILQNKLKTLFEVFNKL